MNKNEIIKGLVVRSSHNIFTVKAETDDNEAIELECRIKGKVLKDCEKYYNPLAPGDIVIVKREKNTKKALVLSVESRKNIFSRFNQKRAASQLLAANVDLVLCVCTPASPPFRPRFVDRVLLQGEAAKIEPIVICNKNDLEYDSDDIENRLLEFGRIGYKVIRVSAKTGEGIEKLRHMILGKASVLTGQSGVGKSSLINALLPGINIREGSLNEKYNRGVHTTAMSIMIEMTSNACYMEKEKSPAAWIIDTPGVRRFIPDGIKPQDVIIYMREFSSLAGKCSFGMSCSHINENGCKIKEAVHSGIIHKDRYESFLRIRSDLEGENEGKYSDD